MKNNRKVCVCLPLDRIAEVGCFPIGFEGEENDGHYDWELRGDKNHGRECNEARCGQDDSG